LVPGSEYLLSTFFTLSNTRRQGFNGAEALSYPDFKAYAELMDEELEPWEVDALHRCDVAYLNEMSKLQQARHKEK
jgi:hypothetical protein